MITLAPAALERVRGYLAETPAAIGLRFGVKRTGCSGWGYTVDLARDERNGDTVFEQDGVHIRVDADSLSLVDGTQIDFLKSGLRAVRLPQSQCGRRMRVWGEFHDGESVNPNCPLKS